MILSIPDVIIDISDLRNENKDKIMTIQEIKEILWEDLEFEEYSIHIFMYNHLQNDLRYSEGSKWSKIGNLQPTSRVFGYNLKRNT